jgi:hypothetical protein
MINHPNRPKVDKTEIEAAITRMRELAQNPAKKAEMEAAWGRVVDRLAPFYLAMRPKPRSFEVHHMNETARYRFACALAAGRPMDECVDVAVTKITGE